jgi:hypothetical protein
MFWAIFAHLQERKTEIFTAYCIVSCCCGRQGFGERQRARCAGAHAVTYSICIVVPPLELRQQNSKENQEKKMSDFMGADAVSMRFSFFWVITQHRLASIYPTFHENLLVQSSRFKKFKKSVCRNFEGGSDRVFRNFGNQLIPEEGKSQ